jgi:hypothetical protein
MNLSLAQGNLFLENGRPPEKTGRRTVFNLSMVAGLAAFEVFTYATSSFALHNLLGSLTIPGINLATCLAVAICYLDVAGIFYLFLPQAGSTFLRHDCRLFTAWLLAAGLNAWLTWHGIGLAIAIRQAQIGWVVDAGTLIKTLPIFIVCLIWLMRILVIGSLSRPVSPQAILKDDKGELSILDEASRIQTALPFELLPHGTEQRFAPCFQFSAQDTAIREPTYRGIPVRYKAS